MIISTKMGQFEVAMEEQKESELFAILVGIAISHQQGKIDSSFTLAHGSNNVIDALASTFKNMSENSAKMPVKKECDDVALTSTEIKNQLERHERKLVLGACSCGQGYGVWINKDKQKRRYFNYACGSCSESNMIDTENLVPATYNCPKCRGKSIFWAEPTDGKLVRCKCCEHIMTLKYDKERNLVSN